MDNVSQKPVSNEPKKNADAPIRRVRRRRRVFFLLKLLGVLLIVVLGAVLYLQSSHAVRNIYLPLASGKLNGELVAEGGGVSLSGLLRLDRPRLMDADGQRVFEAQTLLANISPFSLMGEGLPVVRHVRLSSPYFHVRSDAEGITNLERLIKSEPTPIPVPLSSAPPAVEKAPAGTPATARSAPQPFPAMVVELIEIEDLKLDYADAGGMTLGLQNLYLKVEHLAPGETGSLSLSFGSTLARPAAGIDQKSYLSLKGSLTQGADGLELGWDVSLEASVEGRAPGLEGIHKVDLGGRGRGLVKLAHGFSQSFELHAQTSEGSAGYFKGEIVWDDDRGERRADLEVSQISREFLNPLLAAFGPYQLEQSAINAKFHVEGSGETIHFESTINARELSLRADPNQPPTPPLNLRFEQKGSAGMDFGQVRWDLMDLRVSGARQPLIDVSMDKPLALNLTGGEPGEPAGVGEGLDHEPTHLSLIVHETDLAELRPWLRLAGIDQDDLLPSGSLKGNLTLTVADLGQQISVEGELRGLDIISKQLWLTPLDIHHKFQASLGELHRLDLKGATLEVIAGGQSLAQVSFAGTVDLEKTTVEAVLKAEIPGVLAAASILDLAAREDLAGLSEGRLEFEQKLAFEPVAGRLTTAGEFELAGMGLKLESGGVLPLDVKGSNQVTYDLTEQRVAFAPLRLELGQPDKSEPGIVEIRGGWLMDPDAEGERQVRLTARDIDLAPWMRLGRPFHTENLPPIPLEVDETISTLDDGHLRLRGEIKLGIASLDESGTPTAQRTVEIKNELEMLGRTVERFLLKGLAQSEDGTRDAVKIWGEGSMVPVPDFRLNAEIEKLNVDPYLAWFQQLRKDAAAAGTTGPQKPRGQRPGHLTANFAAGEFKMGKAHLNDVRGRLKLNDGYLQLYVDDAKMADGFVRGELEVESARRQPRLAWTVAAEGVRVEELLNKKDAEGNDKFTGRARINSRGSSRGRGEELKINLQSEISFAVAEGRMHDVFLLDILADQTKIDSFRDLDFNDITGNVNLADGLALLDDCRLHGPLHGIRLDGTVGFDGRYRLKLIPAITSALNEKLIDKNPLIPDVVAVATDMFRFPIAISVKGDKEGYVVLPQLRIPVAHEEITESVRGILGGVVDKARKLSQPIWGDEKKDEE